MFGWFKKRLQHKINVSDYHFSVRAYEGDFYYLPSPELKEWLTDYKDKYEMRYDEMTGERYILFDDKNTALMCKLAFA